MKRTNDTLDAQENVILVDEQDNELGFGEKLTTHQTGKMHRAVSVFLFNSSGQLLLQQRAFSKYHSGGLWSNTCCGHPRPSESVMEAAQRRLEEEMGISCPLTKICTFIYKAELDHGLIEHEFDHVFIGQFNGLPNPNPLEANSWKWIELETLQKNITNHPDSYTVWFKLLLNQAISFTA